MKQVSEHALIYSCTLKDTRDRRSGHVLAPRFTFVLRITRASNHNIGKLFSNHKVVHIENLPVYSTAITERGHFII